MHLSQPSALRNLGSEHPTVCNAVLNLWTLLAPGSARFFHLPKYIRFLLHVSLRGSFIAGPITAFGIRFPNSSLRYYVSSLSLTIHSFTSFHMMETSSLMVKEW